MLDADPVLDRIRAYLVRHREALQAVGVQLAITDRQRCLGVVTEGFADLEARAPVEPDHLFQIGSISKGFTAILVMRAHEEGRLDLDAPVTEYLPWFEVRSRFAPITVHHLLSHTSGLVEGMEHTGEAVPEVHALRETQTGFPPGERMRYSNVGYKTLGLIVERLEGRPWWELARGQVLEPLGMIRTEPIYTHDIRRRLATGYEPFYDDRPWQLRHGFAPAPWGESATADGTICSTAEELTAYLRLLLREGGGILDRSSFERMTRPNLPDPDEPADTYGYGVKWVDRGGRRLLGHSGSTLGYRALALCDPSAGLGVTMLCTGPAVRLPAVEFALDVLRAAADGKDLPEVPEPEDPSRVSDAASFAGDYEGPNGELYRIVAENDRLLLQVSDGRVELGPVERDVFTVQAEDLDRFALRFVREEGEVTYLVHGSRWMRNAHYHGPERFEDPPAAGVVTGHYRSHNPWASNARVFARRGELWLQWPFEREVEAHPLTELEDGSYRVGEPWSPDRARFEDVIDGRAQRMVHDGAPLYRTFTP